MAANTDTKQMANSPSTSTATRLPPNLFTIPAELRNEIYRLALVNPYMVSICNSGFRLPALLQVNQQTRTEAWGIYYGENEFEGCSICGGRLGLNRVLEERFDKAKGKSIWS